MPQGSKKNILQSMHPAALKGRTGSCEVGQPYQTNDRINGGRMPSQTASVRHRNRRRVNGTPTTASSADSIVRGLLTAIQNSSFTSTHLSAPGSLANLAVSVPDLAPALCLATYFLVSRDTLPLFYSFIAAPLYRLPQKSGSTKSTISIYADTSLPDQEHRLTVQAPVAQKFGCNSDSIDRTAGHIPNGTTIRST